MTRSYAKAKGRATHADFIGIPRFVADSQAFKSLSPMARALYLDLRRQHNGHNNGQIAAVDAGTLLSPGLTGYGWAHSSVHKFLKVLREHGLIEQTRQGGIASMSRTCSLYAFTDAPTVEHKEKGVRGSQPTHAYRYYGLGGAHEKDSGRTEGPREAPRSPCGEPSNVIDGA